MTSLYLRVVDPFHSANGGIILLIKRGDIEFFGEKSTLRDQLHSRPSRFGWAGVDEALEARFDFVQQAVAFDNTMLISTVCIGNNFMLDRVSQILPDATEEWQAVEYRKDSLEELVSHLWDTYVT